MKAGVPENLFPLFWEYHPDQIDIVKHGDVIMARIMQRGGWEAMCWLRTAYDNTQIASYLKRKGWRALPPRELNYWALISGISKEQVENWLTKRAEKPDEWISRCLS